MLAYLSAGCCWWCPTLFGILLVNFVVIQARRAGRCRRSSPSCRAAASAPPRASPAAGQRGDGRRRSEQAGRRTSGRYRGAQGLDPAFIAELERQYGFDKPAWQRFVIMVWNYLRFDFGDSFFREPLGARARGRQDAGVDLARPVDHAAHLPDRRSRSASARPCATARRSTSGPARVIIVGYAIPAFLFAVLLIVLFAGGSYWQVCSRCAAWSRTNFWSLPWYAKVLDYLWHMVLPVTAWWSAPSPR